MMTIQMHNEKGDGYIYCAYIVRKDGSVVYPTKAKCFRIPVRSLR